VTQTRTDKKRAQIRAAAQELFLQHGFQATTTDAIAATASISKETLYRYYARKEDLFVDVLRSLTVERAVWARLMERSTEPSNTRQLRALLRTTVQGLLDTMMQAEYLAMLRLIVAESPRFPALGDVFRQTVMEQGSTYFAVLLRSGQRNGIVREDIDPPTVTRMFLGTLLALVLPNGLIHSSQASAMPDQRAIAAFIDHLTDLISNRNLRQEAVELPVSQEGKQDHA
jgi:AcrR family transcriptional regulator